jgi:hypothetical protein
MSLTYTTWKATLANLTVIEEANTEFLQILPACIDYAEGRLYRELDLLNTVTRQTGTLTVGTRSFTLPTASGRFVVTNGFNVITPVAQTVPDNGTRNPLTPVTRDVLDAFWPSTTGAGVPSEYAMITDQQIIVGPAPVSAFTIECVGTIRPTPLASDNATTPLTLYWPDLFLAASMIFMSGYQRNWGAQADDPKSAVSYESQYKTLFESANTETMRSKYASGAWGSLAPTPMATPTR